MRRPIRFLLLLWLGLSGAALAAPAPTAWVTHAEDGAPRVHLYFFWSERCPHCLEARPVVEALAARNDWLELHAMEVSRNRDNVLTYVAMARELGQEATSVPGFLFCGQMYVGFDSAAGFGRQLEERLRACRDGAQDESAPVLPSIGGMDLSQWSLPAVTVAIAALDAFNPCAFFVLLFLLSLLVHERTRLRMLVIGGVFVLVSGAVYFALMAAWLNVFLAAGELRAVTLAAGALAVFMALVNIKDFFWFKRGLSLSIPDSARPKLFERMRGLLRAERWPLMLAGTVTLAVAANSYEALCTAGFPMVYTRLLTLQDLPAGAYYAYLAFYNLIYIIPLFAIVLAFAFTMGSRKLSEREGRVLKLVSGVMMLGLGGALLFAPHWLNRPGISAALLAAAIAAGLLGYRLDRRRA